MGPGRCGVTGRSPGAYYTARRWAKLGANTGGMVEMPQNPLPPLGIATCPGDERRAAIALLLHEAAAELRSRQSAELLAALGPPHEQPPRGSLLVSHRGEQLTGAALGIVQPGRAAVVYPPRLVVGEVEAAADGLLAELSRQIDLLGVEVSQALVDPSDLLDGGRLTRSGYEHACTLCYLVSNARDFPQAPPEPSLIFKPWRTADAARLERLVEATYTGTLDCPQLNGVRHVSDVLAGYRGTEPGRRGSWFVVQNGEADVGCLLLADHWTTDQYELMYMGVTPTYRGRALGGQIVRQAQWLTRQADRKQLVLAVDAANFPAISMYRDCGFTEFAQRSVYLRLRRVPPPTGSGC